MTQDWTNYLFLSFSFVWSIIVKYILIIWKEVSCSILLDDWKYSLFKLHKYSWLSIVLLIHPIPCRTFLYEEDKIAPFSFIEDSLRKTYRQVDKEYLFYNNVYMYGYYYRYAVYTE